jgi:cutinase
MGETVGPALAKKLISDLGASKLAVQGVNYDASIASNVELGSAGGKVMARLVEKALQQCPSTKIALSGYSQGAMV